MRKYYHRFIYEMVVFSAWDDSNPNSFHVAYHFEDYFTSRKAAFAFVHGYMLWLCREGLAKEAVEMNWSNATDSQHVMYRVDDGKKVEFYGIVRNIILQ